MKIWGLIVAALYVSTVAAANYAVNHHAPVPVGFGLVAPAGVYIAGLAFTLRDATQRLLNKRATVVAILVATVLSFALGSGRVAIASGIAFAVSEFADFGVFTAVEPYGFRTALVVSNAIGLVVDSILFLAIAFGSLTFLAGQIVGKGWITLIALLVVTLVRPLYRSVEA